MSSFSLRDVAVLPSLGPCSSFSYTQHLDLERNAAGMQNLSEELILQGA